MIEIIASTSLWIYLTIGVIFIIIDIFLLNSEILIWIGVTFFCLAIIRYFEFSGLFILSSFPIILIVILFSVNSIGLNLTKNQNENTLVGNIEGSSGTIITNNRSVVNQEYVHHSNSEAIIADGRDNIKEKYSEIDGDLYENMAIAVIDGHGEWKVKSDSSVNLVAGNDIVVVKKKGRYLLVNQVNKEDI